MTKLTIALAGNPNAGKTSLFNALTGLHQHTGNWPGKTVEIKSGSLSVNDTSVEIVDLPGTYSLAPYSPDEAVTRDFILSKHPDVIICVVDATNLERHLYLVVQLLEVGIPMVIALNMIDQARKKGIQIDQVRLTELLGGTPIVPTTARKGEGINQLLAVAVDHARLGRIHRSDNWDHCSCNSSLDSLFQIDYGNEIEDAIQDLIQLTNQYDISTNGYCSRWLAINLLESEPDIINQLTSYTSGNKIIKEANQRKSALETQFGDDLDIVAADRRYDTISAITKRVFQLGNPSKISRTDRLDTLVTNRYLGLPIFMLIMYLVFRLVIDVSAPYVDWIDEVVNGPVAYGLSKLLIGINAPEWFSSLVIDGVVAGVGGILTFVPGLLLLFFFLDLLEESGYMARAAFVMDRFMQVIGLHGKSVIPLMLGFGCAVPAIYSTRTISNRRDRLLTALLIPFMSCAARLPVYLVFAMAFFSAQAGTVIWLLYLLGIIVAILVGAVLSRTALKAEQETVFVLELPPYRIPTLGSLGANTWLNIRQFIKNAGTVILAMSVILWFLLNLPWGVDNQQDSFYGQVSTSITPLLEPAGFGSYETSGALITGVVAKEMVVSSLSQIYLTNNLGQFAIEDSGFIWNPLAGIAIGLGQATVDAIRILISVIPGINLVNEGTVQDTNLSQALQENFTSLSAVAFLVFVLLYVPCMATIGAIKQEFGGRWAVSAAIYQTVIAWIFAVLIFQGGQLFGFA